MASIPSRFQGLIGDARRQDAASAVRLELSSSAHLLLASLSGTAGVIHLVMAPSHMDEWALEGIGFALAGWLQLVFAALVLVRPSRPLLLAGIAINAAR